MAVLLMAAALASVGLPARTRARLTDLSTVIVHSRGGAGDAAAAVDHVGGTVRRRLGLIGSVSASVPSEALPRLTAMAGVDRVTPDGHLRLLGTDEPFDTRHDIGSMRNTARTVDANDMWAAGVTGAGVDVAVIDSGVARVGGLDAPGAVVDGPDLSFEGTDDARRNHDGFGHGTHLAGIIAGRNGDAKGIAPGARVVSVRVADSNGATDVSQVIAAIDWVVQRGRSDGLNIRVINLAFGTDGGGDYRTDPLTYAVEVAWQRGVVVVVSAGNTADRLGRLTNPAVDPFVIAVGAAETQGTRTVSDDRVAPFSSRGDGERNPDLVAPGRSIVSVRSPGSFVDLTYPSARVGGTLMRGSGTSQAAAVVAAASALLLQQRPWLSPDQVKWLLTGSARPVPLEPAIAQGAGLLSLRAAGDLSPPSEGQRWPTASGGGSLEESRGSGHATVGEDRIEGERDAWGRPFHTDEWAASSWEGSSWSGSSWSGSSWSGSSWSGSSWSGSSWSGSSWSGSSWSGSSWTATEWG
jgi:serine protease AprX